MSKDFKVYLAGSLRNPSIPSIANEMEAWFESFGRPTTVFADWFAAGPDADDRWRDYEQARGWDFRDALLRPAAENVYNFDKKHMDASDAMVLALPAGKSAHLELGYMVGKGKPTVILLDDPDRWDVMYQFAEFVTDDVREAAAYVSARFQGWVPI